MSETGLVMIVTGPSGAGKSSIIKELLRTDPSLDFSVSHTTRPPRAGERDGVDYYFVSQESFENTRGDGGFLEWARVHDHLYGTGFSEVERAAGLGNALLLDIDVQGAAQVLARLSGAVSVFLLPPDYPTLEQRLHGRGSESEAGIKRRLATASAEVKRYAEFGYVVVNATVDRATDEIRGILAAERLRTPRRRKAAERILATFPESAPR